MADIKPLHGIRYNFREIEYDDPQDVFAPPYDVINPRIYRELYDNHPNNIIRLILNRKSDEDHAEDNRYTRARRHLMDWMATGALVQEKQPAMYAHYQKFTDEAGEAYTRRGFLGAVRLADYDEEVVLPHERTLRGPKEDRMNLMKATECNLSPVFLLYDDPDNEVDELLAEHRQSEPVLDVHTDWDDIEHRLWPVFGSETHQRVSELFKEKQLLIADGHHRYETALAYRNFRREVAETPAHPDLDLDNQPYEFVLAFMVNIHDPGLQLFPTHRVIHSLQDYEPRRVQKELDDSPYFEVTELSDSLLDDPVALRDRLDAAGDDHPSFVFYGDDWRAPLLVQFIGDASSPIFDEETEEDIRKLDVSILHEGILDRILGVDKAAQANKTNLHYVRDYDEAVEEARNSDNDMVAFMNPTPVEQVVKVCKSGGKMPQKSTYFYPKVLSGLTINPL